MRNQIRRTLLIGLLIAAGWEGGCLPSPGQPCGDGWCEEGYFCQPISAQQSVCVFPGICGNGIKEGREQCDDGNVYRDDGCEPDCTNPLGSFEVEPNEDGTPSTGGGRVGNDYSRENANGPLPDFTDFFVIRAAILPPGDEDVFLFINRSTSLVTLKVDTWGQIMGLPCESNSDTVLRIYDRTGMLLQEQDDRSDIDRCSTVMIDVEVNRFVYIHVLQANDNAPIFRYFLLVTYIPS